MNEPAPIEIHKVLADDTRYRLYRYLRLSGRPVPVRELVTRLGLHANTIRPHLRRLVDAGLVASETRRGPPPSDAPRRCTRRSRARIARAATTGSCRTSSCRSSRARASAKALALAREWGDYLMTRHAPPPRRAPPWPQPGRAPGGARRGRVRPSVPTPWEPDRGDRPAELPVPDLLEDHRELACTVHRGLLEGMLEGSRPRLRLRSFEPLADRGSVSGGRGRLNVGEARSALKFTRRATDA